VTSIKAATMKVYICPICNATLSKLKDTKKGMCADCRCAHKLDGCSKIDREPETDCIEASS
jgi:hypothetical protein